MILKRLLPKAMDTTVLELPPDMSRQLSRALGKVKLPYVINQELDAVKLEVADQKWWLGCERALGELVLHLLEVED